MALVEYTGAVTVEAAQIAGISLKGGGTGGGVLTMEDDSVVLVGRAYMVKYNPQIGNWYTIDGDGIEECFTNAIFTERFTIVEPE